MLLLILAVLANPHLAAGVAGAQLGDVAPPSHPLEHPWLDPGTGVEGWASQGVHLPHFLLPLACAVIAGGVVFVYGKQGSWVVASVLTYLAALSTMELAVKCVFQTAFRFPQLLTAMHAAVSALLCLPVLLHRSMKEGQEIDLPTAREFFLFISPIGLASAASIFTNNEALRLCTVSIVVIVASTGCICTMGVVRLLGMPVDPLLLFPATIVVVGCALSTAGEKDFSSLGIFLCFSSSMLRAVRSAMQQRLMYGEAKDRLDPCALLLWSSLPSALFSLLCSFAFEGVEPYRILLIDPNVRSAIAASCINAAVLNLSILFVIKQRGAVGTQLISQVRSVISVMGDIVIFREPVTFLEIIGFVVVLGGVCGYTELERRLKLSGERAEAPGDSGAGTRAKS
mmetsp:Transcript_38857/g.110161  ORF Transcript_38857/g.110161 Transcript_38857/m.110161 type:complete len:398 (-) Transcript_38857:8-1201(-)